MKKIVVLAVSAVIAMSGAAMASGSANVTVNAVVLGTCTIVGGSAAFPNLDPAAPSDQLAVVTQPTVTCSNGTPYAITDDDGANETGANANRMASGGNFIQYAFTYTAGGSGTGVAANMDVAVSVLGANYAGATPGIYNDTVVLTVTP